MYFYSKILIALFITGIAVKVNANEKSHWEVGFVAGQDKTRVLYVYNGNAGDAPVMRFDCKQGGGIEVSHIIPSSIRLDPMVTLKFSTAAKTIQLNAKSELDALTELNSVSHFVTFDSEFVEMLRINTGRLAVSTKNAKEIFIELTNNRGKIDEAIRLCQKSFR